MNLFTVALLMILFPLFVQLVLGSIIVLKKPKWNFDLVCVLNIIAQFLLVLAALELVKYDTVRQNIRYGKPQIIIFFWGIIAAIVLVITLGIQAGIRKYKKRQQKKLGIIASNS